MALPASGPISGSQIATELDVGATNLSLSGMIASSSISDTDPDQYSEFYGYASRNSKLRHASTVGKPAIACSFTGFTFNVPVYYSGSLKGGNIAYTSPSGSEVLANGNYAIGTPDFSIQQVK
jgi:hypothetical protein